MGIYRFGILHIIGVLLASIILLGLHSPSTFAQTVSQDETYDIILEVKRDRKILATAIFGLEKDYKYYIPVQELGRIVNFDVKSSIKNGIASGFIFSENQNFKIDVKNNEFTVNGLTKSFDPAEAFIFSQQLGIGDIYVTPDLLNKIWPLDLELDYLKQTLEINTKKKLPYELLQSRQKKRNKLLNKNNSKTKIEKENLTKIENKYKMFSLPAIDMNATTAFDDNKSGVSQNLFLRGRNDLLNAQANYNFAVDKEPGDEIALRSARFLLEKESFEEGDLPFNLQLMQVGDIRPRPSRLIDGVLVGRGALFSTEPRKQLQDFDQITVEGIAEPGWEVELYRNNELIDFQIVDEQGEYRFENVDLNYSSTIIKTILYGPEGQIRENQKKYNISERMLKKGKTVFEGSILELNKDLISADDRFNNRNSGLAYNYKVKRGITPWLSAFTTFTGMPTRQNDRNYATAGVNMSFLGFSGLAEVYKDFSGGTAYDLRAAGKFLSANINLRSSIFSDFESEEANFDDAARTSRTEFSISKPFKTFLGNLGLRLRVDNQRFKNISDRTLIDFSQTYAKSGLRLTHANTLNLFDDSEITDGRINATYRINSNWQLRSLLNYKIEPEKELRNLLSELRYKNGSRFSVAFDVDRDFQNSGTKYGTQISYDFDTFRLGLNSDWDKDNGFRSFLRASSSFAPFGRDGDYIFSSKNLSNRTSLEGLVYLDRNYDGIFNEGDEEIEDAIIDIGKRETDISDQQGYARFIGSPKNQYEQVSLNSDSLDNPFLLSEIEGYNALLRPGTQTNVEFPVIETGWIEGTIKTADNALSGVRIELLLNNEVIDMTSSAFDGFYIFEYIEPGDYTVRIDPSYEQINISPIKISVTPENLFQSDIDFLIPEQTEGVSCAEEVDDDGRITHECLIKITQDEMKQSALTISKIQKDFPNVTDVRFERSEQKLKMILIFDKKPNQHQIIKANKNKEISIVMSRTNWQPDKKWDNPNPDFLNRYAVEKTHTGASKLILVAQTHLDIKKSSLTKNNETGAYTLTYDLYK